jgi:hypothetical protein
MVEVGVCEIGLSDAVMLEDWKGELGAIGSIQKHALLFPYDRL